MPKEQSRNEGFYFHEPIARLCARYIAHLFPCPDASPTDELPRSIAYALYKAQLKPSITFAALVLITRLKHHRHPATSTKQKKATPVPVSGHRLFLAAYILASKSLCEKTYSSADWGIVGHGRFSEAEVDELEREMWCGLEYQINISPWILNDFSDTVRRDFDVPHDSYPTYPASMVFENLAVEHATPQKERSN